MFKNIGTSIKQGLLGVAKITETKDEKAYDAFISNYLPLMSESLASNIVNKLGGWDRLSSVADGIAANLGDVNVLWRYLPKPESLKLFNQNKKQMSAFLALYLDKDMGRHRVSVTLKPADKDLAEITESDLWSAFNYGLNSNTDNLEAYADSIWGNLTIQSLSWDSYNNEQDPKSKKPPSWKLRGDDVAGWVNQMAVEYLCKQYLVYQIVN